MELLIALVTTEQQTVLDPFAGSGTTCVAAQHLNRNFIGFELDPQYCDIANARLMEDYQTTFT